MHGTYTDDGTLGNYLDYQWEYSPIGKDGRGNPIASVIGEVTSGVITTDKSKFEIYPFTAANNGYYRLVGGGSRDLLTVLRIMPVWLYQSLVSCFLPLP